ncbi:thioredoxin reductase NTRB-like protein, partial [Tanacetum coccineum]
NVLNYAFLASRMQSVGFQTKLLRPTGIVASGPTLDDALCVFNTSIEINILEDIYFTQVTNTAESTFSLSPQQITLWKSQLEDNTSVWFRAVSISGLGQTMNVPGFPEGIFGFELRKEVFTDSKTVLCDAVVVATGAVARRLSFPGSGDGADGKLGFWNKGISACAVCDGAALFLEERRWRRGEFRASKIMQQRAMNNEKIEVIWNSAVVEAYGEEGKSTLGGLKVKNVVSGEVSDLKDLKNRKTITAAGYAKGEWEGCVTSQNGYLIVAVGCMAALDAEHYLQEIGSQVGKSD